MTSWGVAKAKANLSAVLDKAESEGPQLLKRRQQRFFLLTEDALKHLLSKTQDSPLPSAQSLWTALRPADEDLVDDFEVPPLTGSLGSLQL